MATHCEISFPSNKTSASEGGLPGCSCVLAVAPVTTGGWGRVRSWSRKFGSGWAWEIAVAISKQTDERAAVVPGDLKLRGFIVRRVVIASVNRATNSRESLDTRKDRNARCGDCSSLPVSESRLRAVKRRKLRGQVGICMPHRLKAERRTPLPYSSTTCPVLSDFSSASQISSAVRPSRAVTVEGVLPSLAHSTT
jgi:hypothetical protein